MFTFYIVGVGVALLFSLIHLAWKFAEEDACSLDTLGIEMYMLNVVTLSLHIFNVAILSLFSWAVILVIGMKFIFERAKKNKKDKE